MDIKKKKQFEGFNLIKDPELPIFSGHQTQLLLRSSNSGSILENVKFEVNATLQQLLENKAIIF